MVDFERGTKVHGFRGYFLMGDGARLSFAIWNYAMDFFSKRGFSPVIPPVIVRKQNLYGTGHLPGDAEDYYMTQDGDALAGTAEVPLMGLHSGETLDAKEFPIKYLGFSPCFRREAGSHGKDTKGIFRIHEFVKFEQVVLCELYICCLEPTYVQAYHIEFFRNFLKYCASIHTLCLCSFYHKMNAFSPFDAHVQSVSVTLMLSVRLFQYFLYCVLLSYCTKVTQYIP